MQEEITMDFKKATDELLTGVTLEDLASAMGVSVQSVRQARASDGTTAHRQPPQEWERAVVRLAEQQERRFRALGQRLSKRSRGTAMAVSRSRQRSAV